MAQCHNFFFFSILPTITPSIELGLFVILVHAIKKAETLHREECGGFFFASPIGQADWIALG
jgi:hypothetical protein